MFATSFQKDESHRIKKESNYYVNYELRVTNYELGKAYVLWICGIRNVKFNIEKYLTKILYLLLRKYIRMLPR